MQRGTPTEAWPMVLRGVNMADGSGRTASADLFFPFGGLWIGSKRFVLLIGRFEVFDVNVPELLTSAVF